MVKLLSFIPKQAWVLLLAGLVGVGVVFTSYNKGVESERIKWELKVEEQISKQVNTRLIEVNKQLEAAMALKESKNSIIEEQDNNLATAKSAVEALQERLNEVLSSPNPDCRSLPDDEYRLYKDYLSQERQ